MGLSLNQKRKMNKIDFASKLGNLLPFLRPWISKIAINGFAFKTPPRPRPYSLWSEIQIKKHGEVGPVSDYTSWPSLTDRLFSGRHLAPADATYIINLPVNKPCDFSELNNGNVTALFKRVIGKPKKGRSTVLFPYFAQWFTDSFLRSDSFDRRKNTSNHEIDLCQIYGLTEETCDVKYFWFARGWQTYPPSPAALFTVLHIDNCYYQGYYLFVSFLTKINHSSENRLPQGVPRCARMTTVRVGKFTT